MGSYPVRDEALGKDRRGRRYWAFSADPARLWVESPANDAAPWEYEGGTWYFYDTVELVKAMADSLDGADAESGEMDLKKAMRETLPLLTTDMAEKTVQNEEEGWRDEGHEYIGQPVLRSSRSRASRRGRPARSRGGCRRPKKSPRRSSTSSTTTTATRRSRSGRGG